MALIEKEIITEIATQLKMPVTYLWEIMVNAQPTLGTIGLGGFIVSVLLTITIMLVGVSYLLKRAEDLEAELVVLLALSPFIAFAIFVGIDILAGQLIKIWLPEYSALVEIAQWMR